MATSKFQWYSRIISTNPKFYCVIFLTELAQFCMTNVATYFVLHFVVMKS